MYGYIYETTNLINGKKYIGKHKAKVFLGERYLGSGVRLRDAIAKYGRNNFSVTLLEKCDTLNELNNKEKHWIEYYNAINNSEYYNVASGGDGGDTFTNNKNLNSIKKKIGDAHRGRIIVNKDGKEYHIKEENLDDYLEKGYVIGRGNFIKTDRYRKAQRDRNLGRRRSKEYREKMSKSLKGRVLSEEWKRKISESSKTRVRTYWLYNENDIVKVREELINDYIVKGYKRGRGYNPFK